MCITCKKRWSGTDAGSPMNYRSCISFEPRTFHTAAQFWSVVVALTVLARWVPSARPDEFDKAQIYRQTVNAAGWVIASYEDSSVRPSASSFLTSSGTGFLVDRQNRLMVTNDHVLVTRNLGRSNTVRVYFPILQTGLLIRDRRHYARHDVPIFGRVVATDPVRDLAVIELEIVPRAARLLPLASSHARAGEPVLLVGNPGNSERDPLWVAVAGTVERVGAQRLKDAETGRELHAVVTQVRTEVLVRKGTSGGPAVNARGELIGVVTMVAEQNLGVASKVAACAGSLSGTLWASLPCLAIPYKSPEHRAYCIDVSEVRNLLSRVRVRPRR
jgi:S1-C subfamily serine protease